MARWPNRMTVLASGLMAVMVSIAPSEECHRRYINSTGVMDSFVCVCSADFCDTVEAIGTLSSNDLVYYTSSAVEERLKRRKTSFNTENNDDGKETITVQVDATQRFQTIFGFGAAFTDAVGINLNALSTSTRGRLLSAYFATTPEGIGYTVGRVPIASCDFSTREYSYDDVAGDFKLTHFALAQEDLHAKIPYIKAAFDLIEGKLRLFGSPWSSPGWMKDTGKMKGGGQLLGGLSGPYYASYARYFAKFLEEYAKQGVKFWGVTIENEPGAGVFKMYNWQALYFSPKMQRDFATQLLRPEFDRHEWSRHVKIMAHDDQRGGIYRAAKQIYPTDAIDGLAVHWYDHSPYDPLAKTHELAPEKFILATEACTGYAGNEHVPLLGDWKRAELYAHDITQSLRNWVVGWVDWNFALDEQGGPNWVRNFVDAPVITNATADEFYKQPMFYALAHFSKFIPPGSIRISSETIHSQFSDNTLPGSAQQPEHVAFETAEGNIVLVLVNAGDEKGSPSKSLTVRIHDVAKGGGGGGGGGKDSWAELTMPPKSFVTAVWAKKRGVDS